MSDLTEVIALMDEKFRLEPFHTLRMLHGDSFGKQLPGGTCSDKTISFINEARNRGINAKIHTAFIDGKEIHRLARIYLSGRVFFADVGNGWPSIFPYPADEPITYSCFGMKFRTEINKDVLSVYHSLEGKEKLQMEIILTTRPEKEILREIEERFSSNISYPFANKMRFSAVVNDEFRFLRDNTLFIYSDKSNVKRIPLHENEWQNTIVEYFGLNVSLVEA
jgi:arylamine N-acetyltransferase